MQEMTDSEWMLIRFQALSCGSWVFCASTRTDVRQILRDDLTFALSFMLSVSLLPPISSSSSSVSLRHTQERLSSHCIYNPVAPSRPLASLWLAGWRRWASSICNTSRSLCFSHQEMDQSQPRESERALMGRLYTRSQICRLAHTCAHKLQWDAFINASVCSSEPHNNSEEDAGNTEA